VEILKMPKSGKPEFKRIAVKKCPLKKHIHLKKYRFK
jgi:hypothetical protein